jgi:DNA polymerase III subunit epsilon
MFAIIDIETTGTSARFGKITEVAVFVHDGRRIVDEFVSLVNPECNIPYFITRLTGISNEMVATAPRFCEIAKRIVEITEGTTFVADNAAFDYGFIKEEFARLGYDYQRDTLCTVRLSRALLPGMNSYSLGKLCEALRIDNSSRHRAAGDARATVKLFELLLSRTGEMDIHQVTKTKAAKNSLCKEQQQLLSGLPAETGVYYLHDHDQKLIYIGKSLNIRDRVHQHLLNTTTRRAREMKERIASVSFERTGSELVALLKESDEIKSQKPFYNRAQRRSMNAYGLYGESNDKAYLCLRIRKNTSKEVPAISFNSLSEAKEFLFRLTAQYELCQGLNGLYPGNGACFQHAIRQCHGACVGEESAMDYNRRAQEAMASLEFSVKNMLILDKGRATGEYSVVMIECGKYMGFGYISEDFPIHNPAEIRDFLIPAMDNREIRRIIREYTKSNKVLKIVSF